MSSSVNFELEALRAIDGVTAATAHEKKARAPLNDSMVKARLAGRKDPIVVHCSHKANVLDLPQAALGVAAKVAAILGEDAVAEGRRRAEAAREAELAPAPADEPLQASQRPANAFEYMNLQRKLQADLSAAQAHVRAAHEGAQSALKAAAAKEKSVLLAQEALLEARAAAAAAKEQLLLAQAAAQEVRASIEDLRRKRQRVEAAPEPAADEPELEQLTEQQAPHYENFKDYSLSTFRREESREMWRRSIVPKRLGPDAEQPGMPRRGETGALEHWRRGLIGAVQSWAAGSLENVILLVIRLIDFFEIWEDIYEHLKQKHAGERRRRRHRHRHRHRHHIRHCCRRRLHSERRRCRRRCRRRRHRHHHRHCRCRCRRCR